MAVSADFLRITVQDLCMAGKAWSCVSLRQPGNSENETGISCRSTLVEHPVNNMASNPKK